MPTIRTRSGATLTVDGFRVLVDRPPAQTPVGIRTDRETYEMHDAEGVANFLRGFLRADPETR